MAAHQKLSRRTKEGFSEEGCEFLSGERRRRGIRLRCHRGGIAMTIPDYIALGVLATLIVWGAGRVYLETRRF
jgi:hypothetical protein